MASEKALDMSAPESPVPEKFSGEMHPAAHDVEKLPDDTSSSDEFTIDPAAERRLLRKLDLTIFPILYVIYMMSFLDRINISNARIQGLATELGIATGNKFNIALFVSLASPSWERSLPLRARLTGVPRYTLSRTFCLRFPATYSSAASVRPGILLP